MIRRLVPLEVLKDLNFPEDHYVFLICKRSIVIQNFCYIFVSALPLFFNSFGICWLCALDTLHLYFNLHLFGVTYLSILHTKNQWPIHRDVKKNHTEKHLIFIICLESIEFNNLRYLGNMIFVHIKFHCIYWFYIDRTNKPP